MILSPHLLHECSQLVLQKPRTAFVNSDQQVTKDDHEDIVVVGHCILGTD